MGHQGIEKQSNSMIGTKMMTTKKDNNLTKEKLLAGIERLMKDLKPFLCALRFFVVKILLVADLGL